MGRRYNHLRVRANARGHTPNHIQTFAYYTWVSVVVFSPFVRCPCCSLTHCPDFLFPSPFWKIVHGAQEWLGWRACVAAYVDTRTLQFFESYRLVKPVYQPYNNLVTVNGKRCFAFRENKEAEENWKTYDELTAAV